MERISRDGYSAVLDSIVEQCREESEPQHDSPSYRCVTYKAESRKWKKYEGIEEYDEVTVVQQSRSRSVVGNVESHQLLRVNGESVSEVERNQVLNLSDEGERWEGDVMHNQPYGWGVVYDKEGEKAYEGFRIGNVSVCYGTQYYADIQKVEYEGEWCEGKRWGRGKQYDRNGVVMYDGEWVNDGQMEKRMVMNDEAQLLHCSIEELTVSDNSCNTQGWTLFDPSLLSKLRDLRVGDNCFTKVTEVNLTEMHQLENVDWKRLL